MSPRALKGLAAALLGLLLLWGFLLCLDRSAPPPVLWDKARSANKLLLRRPGAEDVLLAREAGSWRLRSPFDYPADAAAVEDLLGRLAAAPVSEPLSEDPARHASFGVEGPGPRLQAFLLPTDAEPAFDLLVGSSLEPDAFFFRLPPSPQVREARGLPSGTLEREAGEWAERLLCAASSEALRGLEVRMEGRARDLLGDPAAAAALARFQADRVLPEKGADAAVLRALASPWLVLRVRYAERPGPAAPEGAFEASFGPRTAEGWHFARVKGKEGVLFRLSAWKLAPFQARPQ